MKILMKFTTFTVLNLILFSLSFAEKLPTKRIGFVSDGSWQMNEKMIQLYKSEIREITKGEFNVEFPQDKFLVSDWTVKTVNQNLEKLFRDPQVDILITLGAISADQVSHRKNLPKPVIAPFVINPKLQDIPFKDNKSGVKNLVYITFPAAILNDLKVFQEISNFKKVAILINEDSYEILPKLAMRVTEFLLESNFQFEIIGVKNSVQEAINSISKDVDGVYLLPMAHLGEEKTQSLINELNNKKLPTFSFFGEIEVQKGVLAGLTPESVFTKIARRVALNVQSILLGDEVGDLGVSMAKDDRLVMNYQTMKKIGVSPSWEILTEAKLLKNDSKKVEKHYSLADAVSEAIEKNLTFAVSQKTVLSGKEEVYSARSNLLPQLSLSATGLQIDKDRAESSFGSQPEKTLNGSVTATQVIFSEKAWANLSIQSSIQQTRIFENEQTKLDIAQETVTAYLNVLRAKTFEKIRQENLKLTRTNLELAQVRRAVGTANQSEIYRWESEIASKRKDLISANSQRNIAEINFNKFLNRPLEQSFALEEITLENPSLITSQKKFLEFFSNPSSFRIFREFMVKDGIESSPEIKAIDSAIEAQKRAFLSSKRNYWLPTLVAQGTVEKNFWKDGAGSESAELPPQFEGIFPESPDDLSWNVALNLSFDLYDGGKKYSEKAQNLEELKKLRLQKKQVSEALEQGIRSSLHKLGASYASIRLSKESAKAARQNLELVVDSYSRGAVSILELLDAQNASLVAEQAAANSIFDFVIDLVQVERTIGKFYFLSSAKEAEDWFKKCNKFFEENK